MNNYEFAKVVEIGTAREVILGTKGWFPWWMDSSGFPNYWESVDDLDETDD